MITITLDSREAAEALKRLADAASGLGPVMRDVGSTLQARIHEAMGRGQTPWGEPFEPLKTRDGIPLNRTRQHLYERITYRPTSDGVEVGLLDAESNKIGRVHQFGATIKPKNGKFLVFTPHGAKKPVFAKQVTIPARPFLPIRPDGQADLPTAWEAEVVEELRRHLQKAMP